MCSINTHDNTELTVPLLNTAPRFAIKPQNSTSGKSEEDRAVYLLLLMRWHFLQPRGNRRHSVQTKKYDNEQTTNPHDKLKGLGFQAYRQGG